MKTILKSMLALLNVMIVHNVYSQSPSITYSGSTSLGVGVAVTLSPTNSGGAVPAGPPGQVSIFAGSVSENSGFVDGADTTARFDWPQSMVKDASGNLYVTDYFNNAIRKITPSGVVSTFAGSTTGASGFTDGTGTSALFNMPDGITIDGSGNLYVADYENNAIRKITSSGVVTTFYSNTDDIGPGGIAFDSSGNLYVAAQDASQIIKINSSGVASVFAGGSSAGYLNSTGTSALFNEPTDVRVDGSGNVYVADFLNNAIRKITAAGVVTTFAGSDVDGNTAGYADGVGTAAVFNNPTGLAIGAGGVIYVCDIYNNDIRKIMPDGTVSLVAGSAGQAPGDADGTGTAAGFYLPVYMYIDDSGTGYISELGGNRIRKINFTGYALSGTLPAGLSFNQATGVISGTVTATFATQTITVTAYNGSGYSSVNLTLSSYIPVTPPDITSSTVVTLTVGSSFSFSATNTGGTVPTTAYADVSTIAGSTSAASGYINATGTAARFNQPSASVADASGNVYVADGSNNAIRMVTPAGVVTTFAGSSSGASGFTDATGSSARFSNPSGIAMDALGNLLVSDYGNNAIRKIASTGAVTTFYHATGTFGPAGLTLDASGNVIVAAKDLSQIMKITPSGTVTTIAGSTAGYVNATGTSASFSSPMDVKLDNSGNLFVADNANNAIREITTAGVVSTFAGSDVSGNTGSFTDDVGTAARFNGPTGLAITSGGIVYVTDAGNNAIRKILPDGTVSQLAGSTTQATGNADGSGTSATFNQPNSLSVNNTGTGYITELGGNRIRNIMLTGYSQGGTLPGGLTFDATTGAITGTPTADLTTPISVTAYNLAGFSIIPFATTQTNNWTGATSTDWNTTTNWSATRVPTVTDKATIGVVNYTAHQPTVANAPTSNPYGLVFGSNSGGMGAPILTINSGKTLITSSTLSPGGLQITAGNIIIQGPGTFKLTGGCTIALGTTLLADQNLIIQLSTNTTLTNNNTSTTSPTFSLWSDYNGCASIATIPASSSVIGPITVYRYVSGDISSPTDHTHRGYRLMSSPVNTNSPVNGNPVYRLNYIVNQSYISGPGAMSGGFSMTPMGNLNNPSIYLYSENVSMPTNSYFYSGPFRAFYDISTSPLYSIVHPVTNTSPPTLTTTSIPIGNGFLMYFRGGTAFSNANPYVNDVATPTPWTAGSIAQEAYLNTTGTLNQQSVPVKVWFTPTSSNLSYHIQSPPPLPANDISGFNLVGNPYPSVIDLSTFSSTSTSAGIYGPSVLTQFSELNDNTGSYGVYDPTMGINPTNGTSRYIQSGGGFIVRASSASAALTFNEAAKTATQVANGMQGAQFLSTSAPALANKQYLRMEMNADSSQYEDVIIWFDSATKTAYEPTLDAPYMRGYNKVSLSSLSNDNVRLAINKQPMPGKEQRVIGLNADFQASGAYHFKLREAVGIPKLYDVWLKDAFRNDSLNLRLTDHYDFSVDTTNSATFGSKRFSLVMSQNPAFAYKLLDFTAAKSGAGRQVEVVWKTQNEENYTYFTVERSIDAGKSYQILGGVKAAGQGQYSFADNNPLIGTNLYRLKQVDINDAVSYSKIAPVQYSNLSNSFASRISIYPNPATADVNLNIADDASTSKSYQIKFISPTGTVVKEVTSSKTTWEGNVSNLQPGVYLVYVTDNKTQTLIAKDKLVKL